MSPFKLVVVATLPALFSSEEDRGQYKRGPVATVEGMEPKR